MFEWDEAKRVANIAKHGVDLAACERFAFDTAFVRADTRNHYGEVRLVAIGFIGTRLYVLVYTIRWTNTRVLSLRKANDREALTYVNETQLG